ncbi:MAG: TonB-dependent receptor [Pseudomonadota bacterium]|nr:TonB-dependent receptor [Pseudomonadota bacterium]
MAISTLNRFRSPVAPVAKPLTAPDFRRLPLALALLAALPALAQQAPTQLETVTVTATKRLQPLQSTPIAITVLSGAQLEEANLNNLADISQQLPTVNFRTNASNKDTALFIRGVGTISTSPGVEPTVSMVIDGVVTARPGQATLDLLDVDRIEVLRGPQGTLFGKNASAGVINVVSRAPGTATAGYVDLGYYQGNERRVRAGVSGAFSPDGPRAALSVMAAKFDGNVTNVNDGRDVNGYDRKGVRGRLDIPVTRDLKVSLIGDYTKSFDTTPTGVPYGTDVTTFPTGVVTHNPLYAAAVSPVVPSPENRQINSEIQTRVSDKNQGVSAQIDWSHGDFQITSITARRGWKNTQFQDQDRLATVYKQFAQTEDRGDLDFTQTSQELRIASTKKQFFEYVAGLFYIDSKDDEMYRRDVTRCANTTAAALPSGLVPCSAGSLTQDNGIANYGVRNKSKAVFGEGTFNATESLRAIAGLRYTDDSLSYYHGRVASATGIPGVGANRPTVTGSTTNNAVSGRVGPQWQATPDLLLYATYSRGYKGPAYNVFFNMSPTQDNVLAPEKSKSYEIGAKSEWLQHRLRVNLAAFQTDYEGYQANVPDLLNGVIVTRLVNAGSVSTKGFELDADARVSQQFSVNASLAHILARVDNFNCPVGAAASCDINGKPLPYSPDWKGVLRGKYSFAIGNGLTLDLNGDYTWQSKVNFDLQQQPNSFQGAYGIVNASVALSGSAGFGGWRVALVGKNLGDKSYATFVQNSGSNINRYVPRDDRRYFGITGRYDF